MNEIIHADEKVNPPRRASRKVAIYACLWLLAISTGMKINGTLLLALVFGTLTAAAVGRAIVTETRAARPGRLTYPAALNLAAWFCWLAALALLPLWLNILAYVFRSW